MLVYGDHKNTADLKKGEQERQNIDRHRCVAENSIEPGEARLELGYGERGAELE